MELDRRGAELLFQVLTEREERSAIAIASNEPFSGWNKIFTDPRLCTAIVDRLTFAGQIIEPAPSPTASPTPASNAVADHRVSLFRMRSPARRNKTAFSIITGRSSTP
jgi:IstB-like ATP binding protein